MPVPANISGIGIIGFSSPSSFFIGYTGSGTMPLAGLGWSMTDKPQFNTLSQQTAGGRHITNPLYQNPLHNYSFVWNFVEGGQLTGSNLTTDAANLWSFYYSQTGGYNEFLYQTRESVVTHGPLANPDANSYVELVYNTGPFFYESIQELNNVTPTIYVYNGSSYTNVTDTCTFYTADSVPPYSGIVFYTTTTLSEGESLVWSGTWYRRVHFAKDDLSKEEFMYQLFKTGVELSEARI
jgi:hypothetical protein